MSDALELLLHGVVGAAMAALEIALTGNAALAIFWPALLGYARESEQARTKRKAAEAMTGKRIRPGAFWHWSAHRLREWLAWPAGALAMMAGYAVG